MLVILFYSCHKNHPAPIELCGRFESIEHFHRMRLVEAQRGWTISRWEVLDANPHLW